MQGFLKLKRSETTEELLKDHKAFALLTQIACRARRTPGIIVQNGRVMRLKTGEALIGDYWNIGLTRDEYREAKDRLAYLSICSIQNNHQGSPCNPCKH